MNCRSSGSISKDEIRHLKQFKHNPFIDRIIEIVFDEEKEEVTLVSDTHPPTEFRP